MKVFISWSGNRSKQVGELLNFWLKCVIQAIDPWISTEIDRGAFWFTEINEELNSTVNAIVCLTKENVNKPWILFEAGALAKGVSTNRVCTFLIDLKPEEIDDPLAQFNHTLPTREDMYRLIKTLNTRLGEKSLNEDLLKTSFNTYWKQFESKFNEIISTTNEVVLPEKDDTDVLSEVLNTIRRLDKRMARYEDLVNADAKLDSLRQAYDVSEQKTRKIIRNVVELLKKGELKTEDLLDYLGRFGYNEDTCYLIRNRIMHVWETSPLLE